MSEHILIVEDDLEIRSLIHDYLKASGYDITMADDGNKALDAFSNHSFDLVLLDIMIPGVDGFEVCRKIRNESNVPIVMISSKKEDTDKILALGLGADDYIEKPFSPRVLVAKVQSYLRRAANSQTLEKSNLLKVKDLVLDVGKRQVMLGETEIPLSVKEFDILKYLMENRNQALSRERIFDAVWGYNDFGDINTVTVHIRKLREKIEKNPAEPHYIETVWGIGYKMRA